MALHDHSRGLHFSRSLMFFITTDCFCTEYHIKDYLDIFIFTENLSLMDVKGVLLWIITLYKRAALNF